MMMKGFSLDEENVIKDTSNLFILKKELSYTAIKDIRNLFWREKETTAKETEDRTRRDTMSPFEHEEE